jgi:hypothetical protein
LRKLNLSVDPADPVLAHYVLRAIQAIEEVLDLEGR